MKWNDLRPGDVVMRLTSSYEIWLCVGWNVMKYNWGDYQTSSMLSLKHGRIQCWDNNADIPEGHYEVILKPREAA